MTTYMEHQTEMPLLVSGTSSGAASEMKRLACMTEDGGVCGFVTSGTASGPDIEPGVGTGSDIAVVVVAAGVGCFLLILIVVLVVILRRMVLGRRSVRLGDGMPGSFADAREEEENILSLDPTERMMYRQAKLYIESNRPDLSTDLTLAQYMRIEEKGVAAWDFIPDAALPPQTVVVENRTELEFRPVPGRFSADYPVCVQTNLPIPRTNEVYYYEAKVFEVPCPARTRISIGLATRPYPFFRLPGRHRYSVAYDSDGSRRFNNSFPLAEKELRVFPPIVQGDVVGVGYRTRTGTVFFTRNGKKLLERKLGGHVKNLTCLLHPTIGASSSCKVHVNVGQMGYVFIEANVKKWGFASVDGTLPPPPPYNLVAEDMLLDSSSSELEDSDYFNRSEDELSLSVSLEDGGSIPASPPPFWASSVSIVDNITLNTLDATLPPVYTEDAQNDAYDADDEV